MVQGQNHSIHQSMSMSYSSTNTESFDVFQTALWLVEEYRLLGQSLASSVGQPRVLYAKAKLQRQEGADWVSIAFCLLLKCSENLFFTIFILSHNLQNSLFLISLYSFHHIFVGHQYCLIIYSLWNLFVGFLCFSWPEEGNSKSDQPLSFLCPACFFSVNAIPISH